MTLDKKRIKESVVNIALATLVTFALFCAGAALYVSRANNALVQQNLTLTKQNIVANTNHHNETSAQNNTIIAQNKEIKYLLGVVVYETGEIHTTQVDNEALLTEIATTQKQVAALAPIIQGLQPADAYLGTLATQLITSFNALSANVAAACAAAHLTCTSVSQVG